MATTRFKVFANLYKDSVTLMQLGAKLREREGIAEASCIMATPANLAQLQDADLSIDARRRRPICWWSCAATRPLATKRSPPPRTMLQSTGAAGDGGVGSVLVAADQHRAGRRAVHPMPTSR